MITLLVVYPVSISDQVFNVQPCEWVNLTDCLNSKRYKVIGGYWF